MRQGLLFKELTTDMNASSRSVEGIMGQLQAIVVGDGVIRSIDVSGHCAKNHLSVLSDDEDGLG